MVVTFGGQNLMNLKNGTKQEFFHTEFYKSIRVKKKKKTPNNLCRAELLLKIQKRSI